MKKYQTWFLAILAFFLPLALYIKTLAPTYIPIDSAEFALCMKFWGICHPPGFPLYMLLGKIFTDIWPFGSLIYKANLLSAIFGAATVLLVFLTLIEIKIRREVAFLTCLFLAVNQILWEFSISADVFAFSSFLIAANFYLVFKNRRYLSFFVLGLSASHFYIGALLWPILAWFFATNTSNRTYGSNSSNWHKLKFFLPASLFFALGFFPQALMYWRMQQDPAINWGHAQGIWGFINYVRRKEFGSIFLIANPILTFSLLKVFKQFYAYFVSFLANFAVFLPIITAVTIAFGKLFENRKIILLILAFVLLLSIQLILLSTIDPLEATNPFQLNKFYLSSFVIFLLIMGYALNFALEKMFGAENLWAMFVFGFLIAIYFFANLKINNYSKNYFSQNMVNDALSQLPDESVAITVSHIVYFGGLYEQKIDHRFDSVYLLYFPNEKNRDSEKYRPELFVKSPNSDFVQKVAKGKSLGAAELYVLETIARNLNRPIYILQGTFEEKFFAYFKPYIVPYGLWWKVQPLSARGIKGDELMRRLLNLRNSNTRVGDVVLKQQKDDLLTYAVAYHSTGVYLASLGEYEGALDLLKKSLAVNSEAKNVENETRLIEKTAELDGQLDSLISDKNRDKIEELGNNLFTLQNYERCRQVFEKAVEVFASDAASWNNLGSCLASSGKTSEAKEAYRRALSIDPNLDLAERGLEELSK